MFAKDKESRFGQTDRCTKDGGEITKPMERDDLSTPTETCTMAPGSTIRLMDTESTATWMEPNMKATGRKINSTVKE